MATLLFFWDYDTQWGADRSRTGGGPKTWGELEFSATDRLLELHAEYDLPACFAVVGAAALDGAHPYHDPAQIRRIHAAGHEVASHSFRHEWLPALGPSALRQTLRQSKDALEQCIGASVLSFVPPYDMPQDYPARLAFNLTERREARPERTDLPRLGAALAETGYRFCRLAYRPFYQRGLEKLAGRRLFDRPSQPEQIGGVVGLRVNTPPGFGAVTQATLGRLARGEGYLLIYGHPHHLTRAGHPESEAPLRQVLAQIRALRAEGLLRVAQPREVI